MQHARALRAAIGATVLLSLITGCAGAPPPDVETEVDAGSAPCAPGELLLDGGACAPAGLPAGACAPGEIAAGGGACTAAGVSPGACGVGFLPDEDGCDAVLPAAPCPPGQMALPGETMCHGVADCAPGPWGAIPIDAATQYVDGAYTGTMSDGHMATPWKTVKAAIQAAAPGAVVAVAAGTYGEDVVITGKPVKLWGACPSLTRITGTGAASGAISIFGVKASQAEVHMLAVGGGATLDGIVVSGAKDVSIEDVWVHDTGAHGIAIVDDLGPTAASVSRSLVEAAREAGVIASGATAHVLGTVVRDTQHLAGAAWTAGVAALRAPVTARESTLAVEGSVVTANVGVGVFVRGSTATIDGSVVENTMAGNASEWGEGVHVQHDGSERGALSMTASLLRRNRRIGLSASGADVALKATTVRDTLPGTDGKGGRGLECEATADVRPVVTIDASVFQGNHDFGIFLGGVDATIETTIVRGTLPSSPEPSGGGIYVWEGSAGGAGPTLDLRGSIIEDNTYVGLSLSGADAGVEGSIVGATRVVDAGPFAGQYGRGISAQHGTSLVVRRCMVQDNHEVGVVVAGASAILEHSVVSGTRPEDNGHFGRGIDTRADPDAGTPANLTLTGVLLKDNRDVAVYMMGTDALLDGVVVRDTASNTFEPGGRGLEIDDDLYTGRQSTATVRATLIERSINTGVYVENSTVTLSGSAVRDTHASADGKFGDGVLVNATAGAQASLTLLDTEIFGSARGAICDLGSAVTVGGVTLVCSALWDIEKEATAAGAADFSRDGGPLACGCPNAADECQVRSGSVEVPPRGEGAK
ncbi:MAG: right-handed parallel beta-helix repeat-containing protein [Minicystis sp.]